MTEAYLKDPVAIYKASFAAIEREVDLSDVPKGLHAIFIRLVHACAMPEIVDDLRWRGAAGEAAKAALDEGAPIYVDATMVGVGISTNGLDRELEVRCTLNNPGVNDLSARLETTRSAAALEFWREGLGGSVVAIGNAPTALFHLLDMLAELDCPRPAAIFAFPIGFIGAAESKQALIEAELDIPYLTLQGRFGGSALAAASINAVIRS